jgi:hypothetical protein
MFCECLFEIHVDQHMIYAGFYEQGNEAVGYRERGDIPKLKGRLSTFQE